ncbi:MAG: discoidin domain-containing protein [Planctomycetes bacterium]|nr:discoidin domain-containing protein [Planctomycetota bacterium]
MTGVRAKFNLFLTLMILTGIFLEGASAVPSPEAVEILKNPSFEEGAAHWEKKGNAGRIETHPWHPYEGKSSYGISNDGGAKNAYGEISQEIQAPGEIKKADLFIFKAWMKSEDKYAGKASLKLEFWDSNDNLLMSRQSEVLSGRFEWTKMMVNGEAPEDTKKVIVKCISENMSMGKGLSYVWFDDISVECPVITASSVLSDTLAAKNVMKDGLWHSKHSDNQWLNINFRETKKITGVFIDWDKDYAEDYEVLISDDGEKWNSVYKARKDRQGTDKIYLNETFAKFMKIACGKSNSGSGVGIKNIEITGTTGLITLEKYYEIVAEQSPAYYPRWLSKKQAYWNTIGVEGDDNEVIICEDGTIEPHKRGFSIIPFMYLDGKLITRENAKVTQSLEKDYLPIPSVKWNYNDVEMNVKLFVHGKRSESIAYVQYKVENKTKNNASGKLFLTIRPLQIFPPWQSDGGFSHINKIEYSNNVINIDNNITMHRKKELTVNKFKIFPLVKPDVVGSIAGSAYLKLPFKVPSLQGLQGDITAFIEKGIVPKETNIEDAKGFASSALGYDFELKPGQSKEFFVAIPLHDKMPSLNAEMGKDAIKTGFEKNLKKTIAYWESKVSGVEIDIPEQDIVNTLKSYVAYNLITKDGPALQPGARSYEKSWIRDGGMAATALLKMGVDSEIREFIDWFTTFQYENGLIPPIIDTKAEDPLWEEKPPHNLIEYDCQGEYVYTVFEYYKFTGDKKFLKGKLVNVKKALEYLEYLRSQTLTPEFKDGSAEKRKYYGILPPSRSHEGYGCEYSYWDDFWGLKGWKDGRDIFTILGEDELAKWADKEYNDFKKCFYDSIRATKEFFKVDYIPASASLGDFDPTSTAVAIMYCDELVNLQTPEFKPWLKFTFSKYYKDLSSRFKPNAKYCFTPYELRTTPALFYMGEKDKGLDLLRFMLKCRRPLKWNQLAEVVNSDYRFAGYFGDMPHTWVGAEYINSVRSLFVYETGDKLILGHGVDEKWLERKEGISVKNMATYYGDISYATKKDGDTIRVKISGKAKPPKGFVFKSPFLNKKIKTVKINGKEWSNFTRDEIFFDKLPAELVFGYDNTKPWEM